MAAKPFSLNEVDMSDYAFRTAFWTIGLAGVTAVALFLWAVMG